jgi:endonuclease/exonuclease/phosphatase family metal-dependent hydrolase
MLAACGGETSGEGTTDTTDTSDTTSIFAPGGDAPTIPENKLALVVDGKSEYQIVVPEGAGNAEMDAAYELRLVIRLLTGVELEIVEDSAPMQDAEIVIGSTMRNLHYDPPTEDYQNGYAAFIRGERIILEGGSASGLRHAVAAFVKDCLGYDIDGEELYFAEPVETLLCKNEYQTVLPFFTLFKDALTASIVYDGTYMQKRMAYVLRDELLAQLKSSDEDPVPELMGNTANRDDDGKYIELVVDKKLENGTWEIEVADDNLIILYAKDYYGFVGGARTLAGYLKKQLDFITEEQAAGDYRDTLTELEQATAYAYDKRGEHRVMFYNVLWDDNDISAERIQLNKTLIGTYLPNVLGLQEMNKNKRGKTADGKGGLVAELEEIGYAEAVDPRVRNAYATNEIIPGTDSFATTGANAGQLLNGYGIDNVASRVTVDGEAFYPYFNCAPLFYNTKTTRLIEAEYYWYKNQWDKRPGQSHPNWPNDCGSKAATWGVFEDLATGDRYIVINTHMCTRSDYIRGLQGQELVDLANKLIAEYDCPVILGGDMNGRYTAANFLCLEENGFVDVEKNNLASIYTSKTRGHHTYPVEDAEKGIVQPAPDDNTGTSTSEYSVDHIMIYNVDPGEMEIFVFGVIIDECSMSGADHFPMLFDFSIHTDQKQPTESAEQ